MRFALIIVSFEVFISNDSPNNLGMSSIYSSSSSCFAQHSSNLEPDIFRHHRRSPRWSPPWRLRLLLALRLRHKFFPTQLNYNKLLKNILKNGEERVSDKWVNPIVAILFELQPLCTLAKNFKNVQIFLKIILYKTEKKSYQCWIIRG